MRQAYAITLDVFRCSFSLILLARFTDSKHHLSSLCSVSIILYRIEFLMHMLHIWHIHVHASPRYAHQVLACIPNLVGIFDSGTYFAITCHVEFAVCRVLAYIACLHVS